MMDTATQQTPHDALAALMDALAVGDAEPSVARRAAHRLGESCAASDLTIEETFELLEQAAGDTLAEIHAEVLGSIVRGYVDHVVRLRGLTRRPGTSRLSSHVARLAALHRINRAATASLQLDQMLSTVVHVIAETLDGDACSVFLYDPGSDSLILRATVGLNPEAVGRLAIRCDAGITGLAATSRHTQVVPDARSHPAFFTYPMVGEDRYTSQVSIPLILREPDRLVGVLNIQYIERREPDQDEITFLETAAGELAIAIENARLYSYTDAALHRRIADLHALRSVARMLASTLEQDELLPRIAEQAAHIARAQCAAVFRVEAQDGSLRVERLALYPVDTHDADVACPQEFIETIFHGRSAFAQAVPGTDRELLIGAPLMTARGIRGVICARVDARHNHTEDRLGLFQAFADAAALAFDNAHLYDEARRGYERASTLLQEMHHRVRNNLQMVAALLSMQARHARYAAWTQPLLEAMARIQSIAAVHSLLSGRNLTAATVSVIAKQVVDEAAVNVVPPGLALTFDIEPTDIEVTSRQATILALLVNECVTNAIEHGMPGRARGTVRIAARHENGVVTVIVEDDGCGLPEGFNLSRDANLGLRIAQTLAASDLGGSFELRPRDTGGTHAIIRFPPAAA